jgi:hypothetical protein
LQDDGGGERNFAGEFANDLCGGDDGAFFGGQLRERLRELGVAVALTRISGGEQLLRCGKLGIELRAITPVRAPGLP